MSVAPRFQPAIISPCQQYRYSLWREWKEGDGYVTFIGLNPSTADAVYNDATIRRCISFAKDWGYAGLMMVNLFAYRSMKPERLLSVHDPIGPSNDDYLVKLVKHSSLTVAAWGTNGGIMQRNEKVAKLIRTKLPDTKLHMLRLTKCGNPCHPLYLPKTLTPQIW